MDPASNNVSQAYGGGILDSIAGHHSALHQQQHHAHDITHIATIRENDHQSLSSRSTHLSLRTRMNAEERMQQRSRQRLTSGVVSAFKLGSYTRNDFVAFINEKLAPFVTRYRSALPAHLCNEPIRFVMDNASIHHGDAVVQALQAINMLPVYLPPYAPTFNPCENVFHTIKSRLRHQCGAVQLETTTHLRKVVMDAVRNVTWGHIGAYYGHCGYRPRPASLANVQN